MRVAILRPKEYLEETLLKLKSAGFEAIGVPFIKIKPLLKEIDLKEIDFNVLIVTSQTTARLLANKIDSIRDKRVIAIGKRTAEILKSYGLDVEIPSKFDSRTIYYEFKDSLKGDKVLILRSNKGSDELLKLRSVCKLFEIKVYGIEFEHGEEQKNFVKEVFKKKNSYIIVFSSGMIARSFIELSKNLGFNTKDLKQICVAIGPPTKAVLDSNGIKALMPSEYTFNGVIELLKKLDISSI